MDMMLEQFKTIFDRPEKVKKLRETILNLAVRGKLVEQNPNDESASVLLERIREEKERLVKEKKIKKTKLAYVDKENLLEIPSVWKKIKLSELCYLTDGVKTNNIKLPYLEVRYLRGKIQAVIKDNGKLVKKNTYLLLMDGENSGEVFYIKEDGYLGSTFKVLIINSYLNEEYINYLLLSHKEYFKKSKKGAAIPHLDRNLFNNLNVGLPSLEEQKRIVEKVDSLMDFCDKLEEALEKKVHYGSLSAKSVFNSIGNVTSIEELEETLRFILSNFKDLSLGDNAVKELKNCILQLAVQGKLVPQDPNDEPAGVLLEKIRAEKERLIKEKKIKKEKPLAEISEEEKPYELPKGWEYCKLGTTSFITKLAGFEYTKYISLSDSGEVPVIRAQNVRMVKLNQTNLKYIDLKTSLNLERSALTKKCLLVTFIGAGIGDVALFNEQIRYHLAPNVAKIELYGNELMEEYIMYYLMSSIGREQVFKHLKATAQPSLSMQTIRDINLIIPPLAEQKRIVEKVDSLMKLCDELEKKIESSKNYSNRLMESILKQEIEA